MEKILLLNAGHSEEPIITELKELGYYVITSGLRGDLPGHKMADRYLEADYSDKDRILDICKDEGVSGIVSCAHDYGLITASYVSEQMGWKGHDTYENTLILHQKDKTKKLFEELNILSPKTIYFQSENEARDHVNRLNEKDYPVIVKAVDQASGVGVLRANTKEEAMLAVTNAFDKSRLKHIIIEPYIIGTQESFNAFVIDRKVVSSVSCNCYSPINPYLIQTETLLSDNYNNLKERLTGIVEKIFSHLKLVDGLITLQYIVKDGEPYLIETMRRCLGNQYLTAANAVNGYPWYRALVYSELGKDCSKLSYEEPVGKYSGHHAIMSTHNGIYRGMEIPDDIMKHVFKYVELFHEGQKINNYLNERMGYIYYTYDSSHEINEAAKSFNKRIKLYVE